MIESSLVFGPRDFHRADKVSQVSRRRFLSTALGGAVAAGTMGSTVTSALADMNFDVPDDLAVTDLDPAILQLINRTTFGFTKGLYEEVVAMGFDEYVESQLDYESVNDSLIDAILAPYDTLFMSSQEIYSTYLDNQSVPIRQLVEATILRAVFSKRQLYERMVEFWTDHFNTNITDGLVTFMKTADDRDVIRQHAMTTFPQLLNASARSGAMLFYLDNYANIVGRAQENYARELMELHTVGVNGPYTQQDVEEVARCLTGWTIAAGADRLPFGTFVFHPPFHDYDAKTVLGQVIPAGGGESDGQTVLDILAYHPATAAFIAEKLCKRFCGYDPPQELIDSVANTYLTTGGDIKSMLRVILNQDALHAYATPKFKRPFHLVASLLRASGAHVTDPMLLFDMLYIMGHAPFYWSTPDGYPDSLASWSVSLVPRWQFATYIFDGVFPGVTVNDDALIEAQGLPPGHVVAAIDVALGQPFSRRQYDLLESFVQSLPADYPAKVTDTLGLATTMPGFQWY